MSAWTSFLTDLSPTALKALGAVSSEPVSEWSSFCSQIGPIAGDWIRGVSAEIEQPDVHESDREYWLFVCPDGDLPTAHRFSSLEALLDDLAEREGSEVRVLIGCSGDLEFLHVGTKPKRGSRKVRPARLSSEAVPEFTYLGVLDFVRLEATPEASKDETTSSEVLMLPSSTGRPN